MKAIVSDAHEVVQCLPLSDKKYKCNRCGLTGSIDALFSDTQRCSPHLESITSGWRGQIIEL